MPHADCICEWWDLDGFTADPACPVHSKFDDPTPKQREEREESWTDRQARHATLWSILATKLAHCTLSEKEGDPVADEVLQMMREIETENPRLRTHSPEEPDCREDEAEAFGNLVGTHERDARLVRCASDMADMGYDAAQLNALVEWVLGDEKPEPIAPEEPVGYVVTWGNALESQAVGTLEEARELLRQHDEAFPGLSPKAVIRPIGQPLAHDPEE